MPRAGDDQHIVSMERVVRMVIFGVSHPEFSTIENINLDLRPGGRSFAIRASGWELPQVVAEGLKSSSGFAAEWSGRCRNGESSE